jgi:hypothetical protein
MNAFYVKKSVSKTFRKWQEITSCYNRYESFSS